MKTEPELTWIDFSRWFRRDATGNTGTQPAGVAAYAETVLLEDSDRQVTLCLGFDDWMKVWVNDEPVATIRHENGLRDQRSTGQAQARREPAAAETQQL